MPLPADSGDIKASVLGRDLGRAKGPLPGADENSPPSRRWLGLMDCLGGLFDELVFGDLNASFHFWTLFTASS